MRLSKAGDSSGLTTDRKDRVLIVGVGGLGIPAAWALARAGVRNLTLVDPDPVELSNLARQVIYRVEEVGTPKVDAAKQRLAARFPAVAIETHRALFDTSNATNLVASHDLTIDATDSPVAKFLINDTCIAADRPFVYGGVIGMTGQCMTVIPHLTACLRCVFETVPDENEIATCREAGILGPVAGAIGEMQAAEAMRALRALKPNLAGKILTYDAGITVRVRLRAVAPRPGCSCGAWENRTASHEAHQETAEGKR
jgi:molybdopterin/thiamine biosynthesis adenylyltransferase